MRASKLISLCRTLILVAGLGLSGQASAGYYIEYMHDPCVDYNACNGHMSYSHHHRMRHPVYRHHAYHRPRSHAFISVYYYWDVYPAYPCDSCMAASTPCNSCHRTCSSCSRAPVEYYERGHRSRYYSATSDVDYDTSTADDMGSPSER